MGGKTQQTAESGKRCCLFRRGTERYLICTSDQNCPEIGDGSKLIGSWGVASCDDCRIIETTSSRLPKDASDDPPKHP